MTTTRRYDRRRRRPFHGAEERRHRGRLGDNGNGQATVSQAVQHTVTINNSSGLPPTFVPQTAT
jgi:hypothetical protein